MSTPARAVGFIGLGQTGFGMAANLPSAMVMVYQLIDTKLGGLHDSSEVLRYYLEA